MLYNKQRRLRKTTTGRNVNNELCWCDQPWWVHLQLIYDLGNILEEGVESL